MCTLGLGLLPEYARTRPESHLHRALDHLERATVRLLPGCMGGCEVPKDTNRPVRWTAPVTLGFLVKEGGWQEASHVADGQKETVKRLSVMKHYCRRLGKSRVDRLQQRWGWLTAEGLCTEWSRERMWGHMISVLSDSLVEKQRAVLMKLGAEGQTLDQNLDLDF